MLGWFGILKPFHFRISTYIFRRLYLMTLRVNRAKIVVMVRAAVNQGVNMIPFNFILWLDPLPTKAAWRKPAE